MRSRHASRHPPESRDLTETSVLSRITGGLDGRHCSAYDELIN
jgi:hypothetical protein